ncbi:MAG: PD40 domain-containing protein [Proteobacteria bacterium]|nr:PD40 domain-containing protein [Pseudomonadota bacterium]
MNANLQTLRRLPSAEQLKLQNLRLRVGDHAVDVGALRVIGDGETSRLTSKAVAVLLELVRHAGNTVARENLLETVWKDRVTTPDVLTQAIKELRRAFADGDKPSQYIETIPKVGYRLLADVSVIDADEIPFGRIDHLALRAENESWVDGDASGTNAFELAAATRSFAADGSMESATTASAPSPVAPATPKMTRWTKFALPLVVLLILLAAVGWYFDRRGRGSPSPWIVSNLRALTSDPEAEVLPHISPDGTRVAFGKLIEATGLDRLFIRGIEPSQLVPLAPHTEKAHDIRPVWSSDGSHIAYERIARDKCTLYIVSSLGGHEREIGDCQNFGTSYFDFAPGDQDLVIGQSGGSRQPDMHLLRWNIAAGTPQPLRYDHASGDQDLEPRYSPDGHWLAFRRGVSPFSDLYVMHADGSGVRQLTHLSSSLRGYTWTADSSSLVFASNHLGSFELYAVGIDGGPLQRLGVERAIYPDAARTLPTVVYQIQRTTSALAEVDIHVPQAVPRKLAASTGNDSTPAVSPDGNHIAFLSDRSGSNQVWLYDRTTDSAEALTDYRDAVLSDPMWRPDSAAFVITVREEPAASRLVEIDLASRRSREISGKDENVLFGGYGTKPGSFLLAVGTGSSSAHLLLREPAAAGQSDELLATGVQHAEADAAQGFVYYTRVGAAGLFRRTTATGEEQKLSEKISALTVEGWRLVDGKLWYLVPIDVRSVVLHEFDPERDTDRVIAEFPISIGGANFSVDPARRHIYLGYVANQDTDIGAFELKRSAVH